MGVMPPRRSSSSPRPYGRQGKDRTIKSLSLDGELAEWVESSAAKHSMSFSAFVAEQLAQLRAEDGISEKPVAHMPRKPEKK